MTEKVSLLLMAGSEGVRKIMNGKTLGQAEPISKLSLSPPRQKLVDLMGQLNFGLIQNLHIRDGDPIFDSGVKISRVIKLETDSDSQPEFQKADFILTKPVVHLFEHFSRIQDGIVQLLDVRHGLPFRLIVEQSREPFIKDVSVKWGEGRGNSK